IDKRNLLEARVIVTTYNDHVRLLSPEPWLASATKVYSGVGADIVMESLHSQPGSERNRLVTTVITSELARQPQHNLPQRSDRHWRIRPLVGTNQHEDDPCCAAAPEQTKEGKTPVCRRTNSEHATIGSICLGRFSDPSSHSI